MWTPLWTSRPRFYEMGGHFGVSGRFFAPRYSGGTSGRSYRCKGHVQFWHRHTDNRLTVWTLGWSEVELSSSSRRGSPQRSTPWRGWKWPSSSKWNAERPYDLRHFSPCWKPKIRTFAGLAFWWVNKSFDPLFPPKQNLQRCHYDIYMDLYKRSKCF